MKKIIPFCVFLFLQLSVQSQPNDMISFISSDSVKNSHSIDLYMDLLIDSNKALSAPWYLREKFVPLISFAARNKIPAKLISADYYLRFGVENKEAVNKVYSLYPGALINRMAITSIKDGEQNYSPFVSGDHSTGFLNFTVPASQKMVFVVKLSFFKIWNNKIKPTLIDIKHIESFKNELYRTQNERRTVGLVFSGMLFMMLLITLLNFIITRKIEFLYTALYSLCMTLIIFFTAFLFRNPSWFRGFYMSYLDFMFMMAGMFFYLIFTRKFLDAAIHFPYLNKFLKYLSVFVISIMVTYSIVHFGFDAFQYEIYFLNCAKFLLLTAGIVFIVMSIIVKSQLLNYLSFGAALQIIFFTTSILMGMNGHIVSSIFNSPFFYYELGVISSIVFFLLGLFYKNKIDLISKIKEQESLKIEGEKQYFKNQLAIYKAQQEERNRISADIHDDLGAGMTSIRLYSELAKAKATKTHFRELEKISSLSDELINKMNAIIWSMSSENDSLINMVAYIRIYTIEYLEGTGIKPILQLPQKFPALAVNGTIRRNIFLLMKEALQNIVKHAEATEVLIIMNIEPLGISLTINDNGKGIDLDNIRQFSNGLKNMRKRMEVLGIDFSIENKSGTLIRLYKQTR
ncbi:MAG: histidine kinase [Ferruginibacter sp.]